MSQKENVEAIISFLKTVETELTAGAICVRKCATCEVCFEYVSGPACYEYLRNTHGYNSKEHAQNCAWQKAMNAACALLKKPSILDDSNKLKAWILQQVDCWNEENQAFHIGMLQEKYLKEFDCPDKERASRLIAFDSHVAKHFVKK